MGDRMSGEYYCLEEIDPAYYCGDVDNKSNKSSHVDRQNFPNCHDNDVRSTGSRKSQDLRLYEIEEQLQVAENRCNTLKTQLDSMKKIYQKKSKLVQRPVSRKTNLSFNRIKSNTAENMSASKSSRKRPNSPGLLQRNRISSPTKKRTAHYRGASNDSIPQKSSSSSTAVTKSTFAVARPKEPFCTPLVRQNTLNIGTDHSGAAVRTINNILSGITESVNRLSKLHAQDNKKPDKKQKENDLGTTVFSVPIRAFTPKAERKYFHSERKMDEFLSNVEPSLNDKTSTEDWTLPQYSITSVKAKTPSKMKWARHTSTKASTKTKIQSSSGSVNLTKSIRSNLKQTDNTSKLVNSRGSAGDEESQSIVSSRKRKRPIKRLKQGSKISVGKKTSDHGTHKHFTEFCTDKLVELYHNVAAKGSESDESNSASKSQLVRQVGGGDLGVTPTQTVAKFEPCAEEISQRKPVNKIFQTQRMLTPINENTLMDDNYNRLECFNAIPRSYELPTIASKMKQVTKSYFQSFNFRSIPFCAAKSITPSHNIGINIQQVMSIMKTRQPITGISATLAHNISLAAEKLQSRPLSVLVSTLSSKMGYGGVSQCPLIKGSMNRDQLQELAKEAREEEAEVVEREDENNQNESVANTETYTRGASGDRQESHETMWSLDQTQRRCTCASQKGVPFQHVLSKYQMASDACVPSGPDTTQTHFSRRYAKPIDTTKVSRAQATKNWIKNEAVHAVQAVQAVVKKKSDKNCLNGREQNLKTVLQNLHDEFDTLNTKYENLAKTLDQNEPAVNQGSVRELEDMEKLLNKKEEEINMVMALYTEVIALKDQVKKLKDRASQPSIAIIQNPSKTAGYKDSGAALHLTQLLRQIQHYQMRYKNKV